MKKVLSILLTGVMMLSLASCNDTEERDRFIGFPSPSGSVSPPQEENTEKSSSELEETNSPSTPNTTDGLNEVVEKDVDDTIAALQVEYDNLVAEIDSYDKYEKNVAQIDMFYKKTCEETRQLCIRLREYSIDYAELILASDKSNDDKYDDLDMIYDNIYEDAGDEIYDEIYDWILDDMYDAFYGGVLDDAYDTVPYKEWSDVHSDEYARWADTRSDVYKVWADTRSDIYEFWSDMRGALWNDDIERAEKKIEKFKKSIDRIKNKASSGETGVDISPSETPNETEVPPSVEPSPSADPSPKPSQSVQGIRPEFKEAMDTYEAFFDEYVEFMNAYINMDTSDALGVLSMLTEYADYMFRYAEAMEALDELGEQDLSKEELLYYTEVMGRISQKLISVAS